MADVDISKFRAQVVRDGFRPSNPGFVVSEGQNPTDPAGSGQNHLPVTIGTPANGLAVTEAQVLTINKAEIFGGTASQFVKGDGTLDSTAYGTGTVTSVGLTMPAAFSVANSPVTSSGTLAVTATGTTAQYIRGDGTLATLPTGGGGTVTSVGLSSATSGVTIGSSPVTTSGTITIAIATASGSQNGLLSSTDWTTFNGKQNALTNPVTGTGASGQVAYFNGTTSITSESNLFWDATNDRLGIGTNSPTEKLQVNGSGLFSSSVKINTSGVNTSLNAVSSGLQLVVDGSTGSNRNITFNIASTEAMRIDNNLNVGLGVTPSAWGLGKAIEFGNIGNAVWGVNTTQFNVLQNAYYDSSYKYATSNAASYYQQAFGGHAWYTAPTGTAGNVITFTSAMTLTNGGNLLVGTTTDNGARLQVSGSASVAGLLYTTVGNGLLIGGTGFAFAPSLTRGSVQIIGSSDRVLAFGSNGNQDAYIYSASSVTQIVTNPSFSLVVGGAERFNVASTGAATFSSSVTAGGIITANSDIHQVSTGGLYWGAPLTYVIGVRGNTSNGDLSFITGSTVKTTITSTGNVGIGTATPNDTLHLVRNGAGTYTAALWTNTSSTANLYVGVGGSGVANTPLRNNAYVMNAAASDLILGTSDAERVRITSGGDVSIGTSESFARHSVYASTKAVQFTYHNGTNDNVAIIIRHNRANLAGETGKMITFLTSGSNQVGSITCTNTATSYNTSSDYRLKQNVNPVENALSKLSELKPCTFNFIADSEKKVIGFLAHEVQDVMPQAVHGQKDAVEIKRVEVSPAELDEEGNVITEAVIEEKEVPVYQGIDHSKLVPLLVAAIQELKTEIDSLKNQIK